MAGTKRYLNDNKRTARPTERNTSKSSTPVVGKLEKLDGNKEMRMNQTEKRRKESEVEPNKVR